MNFNYTFFIKNRYKTKNKGFKINLYLSKLEK